MDFRIPRSFLVVSLFSISLHAQSGFPDPTFGLNGVVISSTSVGYDSGYSIAVQPDGKILVSGESQNGTVEGDYNILLLRYNPDGSLDTGFGSGGIVIRPVSTYWDLSGSVLVQPDGKIVVGGNGWTGSTFDFVALRYNADGTPDNSFGAGGMAFFPVGPSQDNAWDCALQTDGKILLTGPVHNGANYDFGLARLNPDGSLDAGFGNGGKVVTPMGPGDDFSWSSALQSDGKILTTGRSSGGGPSVVALARYYPNGTLDDTFGSGGKVTTSIGGVADRGRIVLVQADGKILVGGQSTIGASDDFLVLRYNADGSPDPSFGANGVVTTPVGTGEDILWDLILQPNGKVIAAGYGISPISGYDFALVRYNSNGSLDPTFGVNGISFMPVSLGSDFGISAALQSDGKIVMTGASVGTSYDVAVARLQNTLTGVHSPQGEGQAFFLNCYPNPFDVSAQIRFQISNSGWVTLAVYDLWGRQVASLVDERLAPGLYVRSFEGEGLAPGMYVVRLRAGGVEESRKVILVSSP